jgi:hypothetical protein
MTQAAPPEAPLDAQQLIERIRAKSAEVMLSVFRLVKTALVHSSDNAALRDTSNRCASTLAAFSKEIGAPVSLSFLSETVFVCGQLLRAPRPIYESAAELGVLLGKVGVSEITFEPGLDAKRMLLFAGEIVAAIRNSDNQLVTLQLQTPGVEARSIDPELLQRRAGEDLTPGEQILRLYATALVALRQFYEDIAASGTALPHRLKRLAQRFVALAEHEDPAMLGMTTMAKAHRDDAGRAVQTAILALAMSRQVTKDRLALAQIVLAALLIDTGRARIRGRVGDRFLSEKEEALAVSAAAYACIASGGVNAANARRTALVTEAAWMERASFLGPSWGGEVPPFFAASVLTTARELLERLAPRDGSEPMPAVDAIQAVLSKPTMDPMMGRLLVRALGTIPAGTIVELTNGAWAVVLGPSARGPQMNLVRIVTDARGKELEQPRTVDLGEDKSFSIAKIVDQGKSGFETTQSFLG